MIAESKCGTTNLKKDLKDSVRLNSVWQKAPHKMFDVLVEFGMRKFTAQAWFSVLLLQSEKHNSETYVVSWILALPGKQNHPRSGDAALC